MMAYRIHTGILPSFKPGRTAKPSTAKGSSRQLEDRTHLALIRQLPCLVSGREPAGEAAHIRYANYQFRKPITGIGQKPEDRWAVPLCSWLHTMSSGAQHRHGEEGWWDDQGIDPLIVASSLYSTSVAMRDARASDEQILMILRSIVLRSRPK